MNDAEIIDLHSLRARKARLGYRHTDLFRGSAWLSGMLIVIGVALFVAVGGRFAYIAWAFGLLMFTVAAWYYGDLREIRQDGPSLNGRLSGELLSRLSIHGQPSPQSLWRDLQTHWQVIFFINHLLLPSDEVMAQLSTEPADMPPVWREAIRLADMTHCNLIEPGHVAAALLRTSPLIQTTLIKRKSSAAQIEQVTLWLGRVLSAIRAPRPYFGGIGRDWANGFTPHLNQFGENVSLNIERYGGYYSWLTESPGVTAMRNAFSQGSTAIALIGEPGVGKTSHAYALAQLLLQDDSDPLLHHRQLISLNPSLILSNAGHTGDIERTIVMLLQEAIHAGHIMLFLDDAQLFFKEGTGTLDITQILLPIVQHRALQLILAMTPHDYQELKAANGAFANLLTPVTLTAPDEAHVMSVLEDTASGLEIGHKVVIAYEALVETYRLSDRYEQDMAMPGKAILLLDQSLSFAVQGIVTAHSVQAAIEQSRGVRVGSAAPAEADQLLHLEDAIHQRMINQSRAVSVVANALRRARAGVANPKRPIGSFLFLGPTGVGKTELARSIAATYFGAETNLIRLDMSEYQQASDVARLLSNGTDEQKSLIMAVRQQPFSVVLLDEIEKAHPNILNLLLQLLDEGQLTDTSGRSASFKDTVVIATSNAGASSIREHVERGEELQTFERQFIDELISGNQFKPELLNRFDEIVLFRPLTTEELVQIVDLMMHEVNSTLAPQNIVVELTPAAAHKIAEAGYDPRLGARPLRRALQRTVEDTIAARILGNQTHPGDHVVLDASDLKIA